MAVKFWISIAALMLSLNAIAKTDPPSLDPIAKALEVYDLELVHQLQSELSGYLPQAPLRWQLRWHILGCEADYIRSDLHAVRAHSERLSRLLPASDAENHSAQRYATLCRARLAELNNDTEQAINLLSLTFEGSVHAQDNRLAILALVMRANLQSNLGEFASALEDLSQALLVAQRPLSAQQLSLHPAMLDFALARTFYYLENYARADEAMQDALDKAKGAPQMIWFIRFNYASVLQRQGRIAESQQQLDQLGDKPPPFGAPDEGYIRYFRAMNAFGLERYTEALNYAESAADTFVLSDLQPQYAQARAIQAQSLLMLGQEERGWQQMEEVQAQLEVLEDYRTLTQLQHWIAERHHRVGADRLAYQSLLKHLNYQQLFRDQTQQAALLKQQQELGQQMDQHRKTLASTAEAHYQNQQSLLLWQTLATMFGLLLLSQLVFKLWPKKTASAPAAPPQSVTTALRARIQQAKQEESPLALLLIRAPGAEPQELAQQLRQDLRQQDSHLQLTPSDHLLLLSSASDSELSWRLAALPRQLCGLDIKRFAIGKTRVHSFDDLDSLMARLEYDLIGHPSGREDAGGGEARLRRQSA